jgi:hypothetical protein
MLEREHEGAVLSNITGRIAEENVNKKIKLNKDYECVNDKSGDELNSNEEDKSCECDNHENRDNSGEKVRQLKRKNHTKFCCFSIIA